jgi:hypothetical protein
MLQNPYELLKEASIENSLQPKDGIVQEADPLLLPVEDAELVKVLNERIKTSERFFNGEKYQLNVRRARNEKYYLGRQIQTLEKNMKYRAYEARYKDNALYEIEASIKPVALSRLPDMLVTPGAESPQSQKTAQDLTEVVNNDIKKRENRKVLSLAFKHVPVYYTGIIKCVWNPQKGEHGDYEFINVHPENMIIDEQCAVNDVDYMRFTAEAMKLSVQDVIMRFPAKETEFIEQLQKEGIKVKDPKDWKNMATTVKIFEVWFTWYNRKSDTEYERIEGVLWKFSDVILKKMKNPNYDYEGQVKYFTYDVPGDKTTRQEAPPELMMQAALTGQMPPNMQQETVYRNYFDMPHKPYFFMGSDQWGKTAYDETSRIEQNIENQENMDIIGKRIIEKLKYRGKHVFSKEAELTGKDIERMDMNNPDQDLLVGGDVNKTHAFIPPEQATQQEFTELKLARDRMFSLAGATNLNGQLQSDTATSNQIARLANYTRADDLTEETINPAAEWMSGWIMQMIKLRYTEEHMRRILGGTSGSALFIKLKSDMIEDGMEVKIKASGADKQKRQQNAMDMAKLKLVDPLTFYQDMDMSDPEGRTMKLMMMQTDPQGYLMKYVMKLDPAQAAQQLNNQPMPEGPPPPGAPPTGEPQGPTPTNTAEAPVQPPQGVQASPENGVL